MDVVEAIDAWIDEQLDDLTDDELERILEILDVVAASEFADFEPIEIDTAAIDELVDLNGGSNAYRSHTAAVLRAALSEQWIEYPRPFGARALGLVEVPPASTRPDGVFRAFSDRERDTEAELIDMPEDQLQLAPYLDAPDADERDDQDDEYDDEATFSSGAFRTPDQAEHQADDDPDDEYDERADSPDSDTSLFISGAFRTHDHAEPQADEDQDDEYDEANFPDTDTATFISGAFRTPDQAEHQADEDQDDEQANSSESDTSIFSPGAFGTDDDFLHDLAEAERTDQLAAVRVDRDDSDTEWAASPSSDVPAPLLSVPSWATNVEPVPLRDHDLLGPSFLSEPQQALAPRRSLRYVALPLLMVLGLAAFGFGMLRLLGSLDEEPTAAATTESVAAADASATEPTAAPEPSETPTASPVDPAAPAATAAPEAPPHPGFAIRLVTGNVIVADYSVPGEPPVLTNVYDVDDDDLSPARDVEWGEVGLLVVDNNGDVLLVDLEGSQSPRIIYAASEEIGEAVEVAIIPDRVAVRTDLGNIALVASGSDADPDDLDLVWDAEAEGAIVTDISAAGDFVPFVLDTGDARMISTSTGNSIITVWLANGQPPAFNVEGSPTDILLGIGQGAVARYLLGDVDGDRFEAVWDPFATDEEPAIGYSKVGDRTAIILADGAIVLADETGTGPRLWDPAETEIRAYIAAGSPTQIIVLLETGSVVRIPVGSDELIESVWDITDETLSAANQIVLEPDN